MADISGQAIGRPIRTEACRAACRVRSPAHADPAGGAEHRAILSDEVERTAASDQAIGEILSRQIVGAREAA
jgi:hypothetical protein